MRTYTISANQPTVTFGKTYVRIPTDIQTEPAREDNPLPEGMHEYSYIEQRMTREEYLATLISREDAEIMQAETLIDAFEALGGGAE